MPGEQKWLWLVLCAWRDEVVATALPEAMVPPHCVAEKLKAVDIVNLIGFP